MGAALKLAPASGSFALKNLQTGKTVPLHDGFAVGRAFGDLILAESSGISGVSSRHCKFLITGEGVFVQDLKSTNGIKVDGVRIDREKPVAIGDGARIKIGNAEFQVVGLEKTTVLPAEEAARAPLKMAPPLAESPAAPAKPARATAPTPFRAERPRPVAVAEPAPVTAPSRAPSPGRAAAPAVNGPTDVVCYMFIMLNVIAYFWAVKFRGESLSSPSIESLMAVGGNINGLTTGGQWWRLFTSTFAHLNPMHIISNMVVLFFLGRPVALALGALRFSVIYLMAGLMASLASVFFNPPNVIAVGASGSIFGVVGALLALQLAKKADGPNIIGRWGLYSTGQFVIRNLGLGIAGIDVAAHLGGLVSGFVIAYVLFWNSGEEDEKRPAQVAVGAMALVVVLACLVPRHPLPLLANPEFVKKFQALDQQASRYGDQLGEAGKRLKESHGKSAPEFVQLCVDLEKSMGALVHEAEALEPANDIEKKLKHVLLARTQAGLQVAADLRIFVKTGAESFLSHSQALSRDLTGLLGAVNTYLKDASSAKLTKEDEDRLAKVFDEVERDLAAAPKSTPTLVPTPIEASPVRKVAEPDPLSARAVPNGPAAAAPILALPVVSSEPPRPAPAAYPHQVPVGGNPVASCRASLGRYTNVAPAFMQECRQANAYSAKAIDVYTFTYSRSLGTGTLELLLKIHGQTQMDCAVEIARRYPQTLSQELLEMACVQGKGL